MKDQGAAFYGAETPRELREGWRGIPFTAGRKEAVVNAASLLTDPI